MGIRLVVGLYMLLIAMETLNGVPTNQVRTDYSLIESIDVEQQDDSSYRTVACTSIRTIRCGPGESVDKYGVCRYVYD